MEVKDQLGRALPVDLQPSDVVYVDWALGDTQAAVGVGLDQQK